MTKKEMDRDKTPRLSTKKNKFQNFNRPRILREATSNSTTPSRRNDVLQPKPSPYPGL
jgi:hypothetical protein